MTLVAAAFAALAALVARPPWGWVGVRLHGVRPLGARVVLVRGGFGAVVAGSLLLLPAAPTILAWTASAVVATGWRRRRHDQDRRRVALRREHCHAFLDGLVAELRAGAAPDVAVVRLVTDLPVLAPTVAVARQGGDVAAALVAAGRRRGDELLATIGRGWAVSESTGAALAAVLERVREAAREDRELAREVAAGVGPARATATLLIAMPPMGLALGTGLGVDPVAVVTSTVVGAACVAVGTAFAIAGVWWIDRVADRVEEPP